MPTPPRRPNNRGPPPIVRLPREAGQEAAFALRDPVVVPRDPSSIINPKTGIIETPPRPKRSRKNRKSRKSRKSRKPT